ncbi:hypothetical protein EDD11_004345 [Mortierella claussenii]|nr:hypothetical protein EDD11_004345 [Mortierella claussenii]
MKRRYGSKKLQARHSTTTPLPALAETSPDLGPTSEQQLAVQNAEHDARIEDAREQLEQVTLVAAQQGPSIDTDLQLKTGSKTYAAATRNKDQVRELRLMVLTSVGSDLNTASGYNRRTDLSKKTFIDSKTNTIPASESEHSSGDEIEDHLEVHFENQFEFQVEDEIKQNTAIGEASETEGNQAPAATIQAAIVASDTDDEDHFTSNYDIPSSSTSTVITPNLDLTIDGELDNNQLMAAAETMGNHQPSAAIDPSAVAQTQPIGFLARSYPLRERTIQQRQPYTVDKQQHAYFYKKRNNTSLARDASRDDLFPRQDDEEDSDYESDQERSRPMEKEEHSIPKRRRHFHLPDRGSMYMDALLHDLDNDGLPSIDELRRQFISRQGAASRQPSSQDLDDLDVQDEWSSLLSPATKRGLRRLAGRPNESSDSTDENLQITSRAQSPSVRSTLSPRSVSPGLLSDSRDRNQEHVVTNDNGAAWSTSDLDSVEEEVRPTKKSKRAWQHVLPRSFFKQHNLPQDPAALRAMRTKDRSKAPDQKAPSKPERTLPAHVAKRRIPTTRQGDDGLNDFIARLGREQSDSEEEPVRSRSPTISHHNQDNMFQGDLSPDEAWSLRPTLKDTEAFQGAPEPSKYVREYRSPAALVLSSDEDEEDEADEIWRQRRELSDLSYASSTPARKPSVVARRMPQEDLIDRMLVRSSSRPLKPKQASLGSGSKKRRRVSGNHPPLNHRRSKASGAPSRPRKRINQYFQATAREEDHGSDSTSWADFQNASFDRNLRRRTGGDLLGNYTHTYRHIQESDSYDSDQESINKQQWSAPELFGRNMGSRGLDYAAPRISPVRKPHSTGNLGGITIISGGKSVSKPRQSRVARPSLAHRRTRPAQQRKQQKQRQKTISQGTLYSVVENAGRTTTSKRLPVRALQTLWTSRIQPGGPPQHVGKPLFQMVSKKAAKSHTRLASRPSPPRDLTQRQDDTTVASTGAMDQPAEPYQSWANNETMPTPAPTPESPEPQRPIAVPRSKAKFLRSKNDILLEGVIPNGLYFSRDTYIGRGALSRVLSAMAMPTQEDAAAPFAAPELTFFGRPFNADWNDMTMVEHELGLVVLDWKRRFQLIRDWSQAHERAGFHAPTELDPALATLEGLTKLLVERFAASTDSQRGALWRAFKSAVVEPLVHLMETERTERKRSLDAILALWTRWALMTWTALAECVVRNEYSLLENALRSLLTQLLHVSDTAFLTQLEDALDPLRGGIQGGEDVMEVWACLIQLLNRYSELQDTSPGFWESFNRQLQQQWEDENRKASAADDSTQLFTWQVRANHLMSLLQQLCRLHQFESNGSSNGGICVKPNWQLVQWLLDHNWLGRVPSDSADTEYHVRRFLTFCHSRMQAWGWPPCVDVIVSVYRHFSKQGFRDMPTEPGYRLPEFLKRMISRVSRPRITPAEADDKDSPELMAGLDINMSLVSTVEEHDRCFEIFLKILAKTIRWQLCEIDADQEDIVDGTQKPNTVYQWDRTTESLSYQAAMFETLDRSGKIKVCKRMLSAISLPVCLTMPSSEGYSYSSVCNLCNLVLTIDLLVPDVLRSSSIGQMRSILLFENSDNASRRISLESIFYLATIWQRQRSHKFAGRESGRQLEKVLDNMYGRLNYLCASLESEWTATGHNMVTLTPLTSSQSQTVNMISVVLGQLIRLLHQEKIFCSGRLCYPSMAYLDQRLERVLTPDIPYSQSLREQALDVIGRFFALRRAYGAQCIQATVKPTKQISASLEDEFGWLDDDQLVLDENDLVGFAQPAVESMPRSGTTTATTNSTPDTAVVTSVCADEPEAFPQDANLRQLLISWIYPSLQRLIKAQHQVYFDAAPLEQQVRRNLSVKHSGELQMSAQGAWLALGVYADCGAILIKQRCMQMHEISGVFSQKPSYTPWMQFRILQDQLVWATRLAECWPKILIEHEDVFLRVWFSTIGLPTHELTLQHRLTKAITDTIRTGDQSMPGFSTALCYDVFKDLLVVPSEDILADMKGKTGTGYMSKESREKTWWLQKMMVERPKVLEQVLCNMGEHYRAVRDGFSPYRAAAVKSRYQGYLHLLLARIKSDFERLESKQLALEATQLASFSHLITGYVIQHCGSIIKDSGLQRSENSILNFLMSPRHFPQPPVDRVQIVCRIRGYAVLHNEGEDHFFQDLLEMILSQLKLIPGNNKFRYAWPNLHCPSLEARVDAPITMRITDRGISYEVGLENNGEGIRFSTGLPTGPEDLNSSTATTNSHSGSASKNPRPVAFTSLRGLSGQPWRTIIQTLLRRVHEEVDPKEESLEAMWALTASIDNAGIFGENWMQWNTLASGFRTMVLVSTVRPLLTAFLGTGHQQAGSPRFLPGDGGMSVASFPQRPELMVVSVATCHWLVSLIEGLLVSVDSVSGHLKDRPFHFGQVGDSPYLTSTALMTLQGFQYETAMVLPSLLHCLVGCFNLLDSGWLAIVRERLGDLRLAVDAPNPFMENSGDILRALHLFGQILQVISAMVPAVSKIQIEYPGYYVKDKRNGAWRNALMVLVQVALDRGLFLMNSLGGPLKDEHAPDEDESFADMPATPSQAFGKFMHNCMLDDCIKEDRVPGTLRLDEAEARFPDFLEQHARLALLEKKVHEHIHRLSSMEDWYADELSFRTEPRSPSNEDQEPNDSSEASPKNLQAHQQGRLDGAQQAQTFLRRAMLEKQAHFRRRLKRQDWILWSFQSSFFDFCRAVSALNPRFARQVRRGMDMLLDQPQQPDQFLYPDISSRPLKPLSRCRSVWRHILDHGKDPYQDGRTLVPSWTILQWCMHREWKLALLEYPWGNLNVFESDADPAPWLL